MSNTTGDKPKQYTVWIAGRTVRGTPKSILENIQRHARDDSEVRNRTVEDYAQTLIKDAPYFFPDGQIPWLLEDRQYTDMFEQALEYLSVMPASGLRIVSSNGRRSKAV